MDFIDLLDPRDDYWFTGYYYPKRPQNAEDGKAEFKYRHMSPYSRVFDKPIRYVAYLFCLYAFMWFIYSQVTYIANIFVAIDGYTFSGGFIATAVMYVLSFLFTLLAAILNNWKPWGKKAKEEVRA